MYIGVFLQTQPGFLEYRGTSPVAGGGIGAIHGGVDDGAIVRESRREPRVPLEPLAVGVVYVGTDSMSDAFQCGIW